VLVMLLRLRQLCSHPSLIQEDSDDVHVDGIESETLKADLKRALRLGGVSFVGSMKKQMVDLMQGRILANKNQVEPRASLRTPQAVLLNSVLQLDGTSIHAGDQECPICQDCLSDPVVTLCQHQ
jgi:SNF2 family DNA or RNA helicase